MRCPRENGVSQALTIKGGGKLFPLLQSLITRMSPPGKPHRLQRLKTGSGKTARRIRILTKVSSICGARSRDEGKISHCPFLSKFRLAIMKIICKN